MLLTLSNYVVQPPGDEDHQAGDPGEKVVEPKEPPPGSQQTKPTPPQEVPPAWGASIPDTGGRSDSMAWFQSDKIIGLDSLPGEAAPAIETAHAAGVPGAKPRRGVLGLHPLALLAGLVAFHIFIVTVAGK